MKWTNRINHDMIGYSNQIHNHSNQKIINIKIADYLKLI